MERAWHNIEFTRSDALAGEPSESRDIVAVSIHFDLASGREFRSARPTHFIALFRESQVRQLKS